MFFIRQSGGAKYKIMNRILTWHSVKSKRGPEKDRWIILWPEDGNPVTLRTYKDEHSFDEINNHRESFFKPPFTHWAYINGPELLTTPPSV
jgi:hypothetical protein